MNSNASNFHSVGNQNFLQRTVLPNSTLDVCSIPSTTKNFAIAILLIVICIVTFCGNSVVCLTVYANRNLHTTTNFLIVSLALADLLVSLTSMPFRIDSMLHNEYWCHSVEACALWIWIDLVACSSSIGSLAAVSIERFVAIKHPLRYPAIMTHRTGLVMILVVWSYSAIWASLGHYNWTSHQTETFTAAMGCGKNDRLYYTIVSCLAFLLPLGIVTCTYSYLTRVAFRQRQRALTNTVCPAESTDVPNRVIRRSRILQELQAAKMMACVVGAFCISWLPFFILLHLSLWHRLQSTPAITEIFVTVLPNLNSSLNPFLYMAFTRELRQQVGKMIKSLPGFNVCCRYSRSTGETSVLSRTATIGETDIRQPTELLARSQ